MPYLATMSFMKDLEPSSSAAAALGPKALMPFSASRSASPATSATSGPTTTRSMAIGDGIGDQSRHVVGGDRDAFGDFGDAGIAGRGGQLGGQRRFGDAFCQRMLAAAAADEENVQLVCHLLGGHVVAAFPEMAFSGAVCIMAG